MGEAPAVSTRGSKKPEPFRMHKARSHNSTATRVFALCGGALSLAWTYISCTLTMFCTLRAFASSMLAACAVSSAPEMARMGGDLEGSGDRGRVGSVAAGPWRAKVLGYG